jgi:S-(hydroxymethyl)glutathione dehydrogenase/alcohol dehydrogenase
MKMRAAVAWEPGRALCIESVELEGPKAGEVLVRILAAGVCHTDAFTLAGADPQARFPAVLGHEGAGIVEAVGRGVASVRVGDHVIPLQLPECGECEACTSGRTNLCTRLSSTHQRGLMPDGTSRLSARGRPLLHFMGTSTFAEYTVLPEIAVARVAREAPLEKICLFGCSLTTGIGAVLNTARVAAGSSVAVFGLGAVGLAVVQGAVLAQAGRIIGVDVNPARWPLAQQLGATDYLNPKNHDEPIEQVIVELTRGGVDYAFECIGNVHVMRAALECCRRGWGEAVVLGLAGAGQDLATRPAQLIEGRVWRGSTFGGVKGRTQLPGYIDRYLAGEIRSDGIIGAELPLEKINRAFDLMQQGRTVRAVIRP